MRKNKSDRKNLKTGAELYTLYEVRGMNTDGLVNSLQKKGVGVYRARKIDAKRLRIGIKFCDDEKFFAICKDLWYTDIKKVKEYGRAYPFLFLLRNFGLVLGSAFFFFTAAFADDFIFGFSYKGTGAVCRREVSDYLSSRGITVFSRFSDVDVKALSADILADNPRLTFARCRKEGNRLIIDLALKENGEGVISPVPLPLVSDADGIIKELRIYRGTAAKSVGEEIKAGDVLVCPYAEIKDVKTEVSVLAYAVIESRFIYEYVSDKDGEEAAAEIFAENALGERVASSSVEKTEESGKFIYKVTLSYERVLYSGNPKE